MTELSVLGLVELKKWKCPMQMVESRTAHRVTAPRLKRSEPMHRKATPTGNGSMGPGQPPFWLTEEAYR
jgi:hypothetical protein